MGFSANIPKMDLKSQANSTRYVKSLIFLKKEFAIEKLISLLPFLHSCSNDRLKEAYMKSFPVVFGYAELNRVSIEQCLELISIIECHPFFKHERRLFNSWNARLSSLLRVNRDHSYKSANTSNTFVNIPGTNLSDVIGYTDLDLFYRYHKWLKYHKLHKYLYFFGNLSAVEIESITRDNIRHFEQKVDILPMTEGARNSILRKLDELHQRRARLEIFCKEEYYTSVSKIEKSIFEMKTMLKTPIRRNQLFSRNNLPDLLRRAMETVVFVILRRLQGDDLLRVYQSAVSLLKMAWGCSFFETAAKNKMNVLQHALHTKLKKKAYSRKMKGRPTIYVDYSIQLIETGIKNITFYLENFVLE